MRVYSVLTVSPELTPAFLKLANKRAPGNLELGTGAKGGLIHGVLWYLK